MQHLKKFHGRVDHHLYSRLNDLLNAIAEKRLGRKLNAQLHDKFESLQGYTLEDQMEDQLWEDLHAISG